MLNTERENAWRLIQSKHPEYMYFQVPGVWILNSVFPSYFRFQISYFNYLGWKLSFSLHSGNYVWGLQKGSGQFSPNCEGKNLQGSRKSRYIYIYIYFIYILYFKYFLIYFFILFFFCFYFYFFLLFLCFWFLICDVEIQMLYTLLDCGNRKEQSICVVSSLFNFTLFNFLNFLFFEFFFFWISFGFANEWFPMIAWSQGKIWSHFSRQVIFQRHGCFEKWRQRRRLTVPKLNFRDFHSQCPMEHWREFGQFASK